MGEICFRIAGCFIVLFLAFIITYFFGGDFSYYAFLMTNSYWIVTVMQMVLDKKY